MASISARSYQEFLVEELKSRKAQNPQFSMRSFAKFLSISPAQLSRLISGKRNLTPKQALKIAEKLGLSRHQLRSILSPVENQIEDKTQSFQTLKESEFSLISDWTYYAILSLGKLADNKAEPKWIAKRLGISEKEASASFNRLRELGYIHVSKKGTFKQSTKPLTISSEVGSAVIRKYHKQNLDLAKEKIEQVEASQRDFSSVTMAIHPAKIEKAKMMITDFRRAFAAEMELGEKSEIYTLALQFFPLTILERSSS